MILKKLSSYARTQMHMGKNEYTETPKHRVQGVHTWSSSSFGARSWEKNLKYPMFSYPMTGAVTARVISTSRGWSEGGL